MNRQQEVFRPLGQIPYGFADMTLAGMWQMFDVQMAALRTIAEAPSHAAQAFGFPPLFPEMRGDSGDHLRDALARSAEHWAGIARRASETALNVQRQAGRVVETQVDALAQSWEQSAEQLATQAEKSFKRLGETAEQQASQLVDATIATADATRTSLQGAGEQLQHSADRASRQVRDSINRGGEAMREQAQNAAKAAREASPRAQRETRARPCARSVRECRESDRHTRILRGSS